MNMLYQTTTTTTTIKSKHVVEGKKCYFVAWLRFIARHLREMFPGLALLLSMASDHLTYLLSNGIFLLRTVELIVGLQVNM